MSETFTTFVSVEFHFIKSKENLSTDLCLALNTLFCHTTQIITSPVSLRRRQSFFYEVLKKIPTGKQNYWFYLKISPTQLPGTTEVGIVRRMFFHNIRGSMYRWGIFYGCENTAVKEQRQSEGVASRVINNEAILFPGSIQFNYSARA